MGTNNGFVAMALVNGTCMGINNGGTELWATVNEACMGMNNKGMELWSSANGACGSAVVDAYRSVVLVGGMKT